MLVPPKPRRPAQVVNEQVVILLTTVAAITQQRRRVHRRHDSRFRRELNAKGFGERQLLAAMGGYPKLVAQQ